ncbi:chemotaxis protein CheW [Chamaesiphon sp. VAR_48_metabat_403]|uniref:chemotaxis protein CheW n=1 Tax=Chamaesiphon sp. VAR_48_metabat_403 TaxID=2964700 RepID=UPI00286E4F1F|nr:chemotaxis protein CheW [Chamaesiphon sp. VAR_48_metabat_403]
MSEQQNLIFGLHGSLYGISANFVREICWLPELNSLATAPVDILGIFNWRSRMVPVMHLDLRFGKGFSGCNISDRVIVVEFQGTYMGIVAHEVFDVQTLEIVPIDLALIQARSSNPIENQNFITGIAQRNEQPVICLDLDRAIREPDVVADPDNSAPVVSGADLDFYRRCCPNATVADRATFATRALQLKTSIVQAQSVSVEQGVLVVQIGTDYIGFPLELIVDVDALDRFAVSFVPVAPTYILGQINWRGQILPVVELGSVLQIPALPRQELVVVELKDGIKIGIAVDRIFDVFYITTERIEQLPLAKGSGMRTYMLGMTAYQDSLMYLVKLQELLEREFLPTTV